MMDKSLLPNSTSASRAFSVKALIAGIIGLLFLAICGKMRLTLFMQVTLPHQRPHQLDAGIYFYFLLLCVIWNPICTRYCARLAFSAREMLVVMFMTFLGAGYSFGGWLQQLYTQGILMTRTAVVNPQWNLYSVLDYTNRNLLPNGGIYDENAIGGFINGLRPEHAWIPWKMLPFENWGQLLFWVPMILLLTGIAITLLIIVHRQWVVHEKLSYPLVTITESLMQKKDDRRCFADLFYHPAFLLAFGMVFFIHTYNCLVMQYSSMGFEPIPLKFWLRDIQVAFPVIAKAGAWSIRSVYFYFVLIGLAYFLAPALSLSVGLNAFIYILFAAQIHAMTGQAPGNVECQLVRFGAYAAFAILLLSLGRRYYGRILCLALSARTIQNDEKAAVWACRIFLIFNLLCVYMLTIAGFSIGCAIAYTLIILMTYLIFTRIICECGIPWMNPPFLPAAIFPALIGGSALGAKNIMAGGMISGVFFAELKQLSMPFLATGMKLAHDAKLKLSRTIVVSVCGIMLVLAIAIPMHLRQYYSFGIQDAVSKSTTWRIGVQEAVNELGKLYTNGQLGSDGSIASAMPEKSSYVILVLLGMALVLVVGFLRSRFAWWPLHPVLFCIWNTEFAFYLWPSFLLGFVCRTLAIRLGGERGYLAMKPFFLGLIFADLAASGILLVVGMLHYLLTGNSLAIPYQM